MNRKGNEALRGPNARNSSRKRWVIIVVLLVVVATGVAALWFLRGTDRGNLAGRPVPTPDFDKAKPSADGVAPRPSDLLITIQPEKLETRTSRSKRPSRRPPPRLPRAACVRRARSSPTPIKSCR